MGIVRRNPKPLKMPQLKRSATAAGVSGALAFGNRALIPNIINSSEKPELVTTAIIAAELIGALAISNKYPTAGAAIAGPVLASIFQGALATITGDFTILASNPRQAQEMIDAFANEYTSEISGLPTNVLVALTGSA